MSAVEADVKPQFGAKDYIEYLPGTLPLVIAAPHGGSLRPDGIPNRTFGRVAQDSNTQEMARLLREELLQRFGGAPHVIICRLHRLKVDCNRELNEAAQGDKTAVRAWQDFQGFVKKATDQVRQSYPAGLFIDLHGHRHPEGRVEIGYLLSASILARSDAELEADKSIVATTGIRELAERSPATFVELLRGPSSLGGLLQKRGYASVPSPAFPGPKEGEEYFPGGYNTATHGSRNGGVVSGLQIECPFQGVRDKPENQKRFCATLADALGEYWRAHFKTELKASKP